MWARWVVRRDLCVAPADELDLARVSTLIDDASRAIERCTTIRKYHTQARKGIEHAGVELDALVEEVRESLDAIGEELAPADEDDDGPTPRTVRGVAWGPWTTSTGMTRTSTHDSESDALIDEALAAARTTTRAAATGRQVPAHPLGSVAAAGLLGLRDALEGRPEKEETAVVVDAPREAHDPKGPIEVTLDFDHPERSRVVIRTAASRAGADRRQRPPHAAIRTVRPGLPVTTSRVTSRAGLSSRRPRNAGWRMRPTDVHSVKRTSATSSRLDEVDLALGGAALERVGERARVAGQWRERVLDAGRAASA